MEYILKMEVEEKAKGIFSHCSRRKGEVTISSDFNIDKVCELLQEHLKNKFTCNKD